jgi:hypothetical protein
LSTTVCQGEPSLAGFTQASTVIPVVSSSEVASAIVTRSLTPSKESAEPCLPAPVQAAPEMTPALPLPEASPALVPPLSPNP